MKRIALFGGSFDPPHVGHQMACLYVLATAPVDELWLVPVHLHAFGKPLTAFDHRLAMCERMRSVFSERVRVSDVEREIGGVSRTVETVRHLARAHPADRFSVVVGADAFAERRSWYEIDALEALAEFIVVGRVGYAADAAVALPDVSSTEIRRRLAAGEPCDHLVPREVLAYARAHRLYVP